MSDLRNTIGDLSDEQLLTALFREKDQYTEEALGIMRNEMLKRDLKYEPDGYKNKDAPSPVSLNSEDFVRFDHSFSRINLMFASAILNDNAIPHFVGNPSSSDSIPTESEAEKGFTVFIHKSSMDKAHELLDEHFIKSDQSYLLKYTGARERLKAFNFNDIHLTEKSAEEELDVFFTLDEKNNIISLGNRLLQEADQIENKLDRMLFYFDSIEPLIERLKEPDRVSFSRNDLLTMLEILQVYADDPALPASMDELINQLLTFFLET